MASKKMKQKSASNPAESATVSINERILGECHQLYIDANKGLVKVAANLGLSLLAPRKKITVMLIGNHSAGKSSFINWYIDEHVQKTGVAIETQGFTLATSGRKRESLTGNATLHLLPHLEPLRKMEGVIDYLTTEISTSKERKFALVNFIDTPGLVDGDMKYPFDVNQSLVWLADMADLIFVFFDPIGQALCKRTLNIVEEMSYKHADKIRYYLSKADEAGMESDRQRVMMQIVQELCKRPNLNRTGFDMPTIYIPPLVTKQTRCTNQIENVCRDIEKTINHTIQNTLNSLERDCLQIDQLARESLARDDEDSSYNLNARVWGSVFFIFSGLLFTMLFIGVLTGVASEDFLISSLGSTSAEYLQLYTSPIRGMWSLVPDGCEFYVLTTYIVTSFVLFFYPKYVYTIRPTMSRKERRTLNEQRVYIHEMVKKKKEQLYSDYLKQSISEQDE